MNRAVFRLLLVAPAILAAGCGMPDAMSDAALPPFEVRDSAGIEIVESGDSLWRGEDAWRLSTEPVLTVGGTDESRVEASFQAVGPVRFLASGVVAIVDVGLKEVRLFDLDGDFVRTLGREGQGPRELAWISAMDVIRGDTVVVRDRVAAKSLYFASDGSGVRLVMEPPRQWGGLRRITVEGWTPEGSAIVTHRIGADEYPERMQVVRQEWHLFDAAGEHRHRIDSLPMTVAREAGALGAELVWGGRGLVQPAPNGIWYTFSSRPELVRYEGGRIVRILRFGRETPAIPESLKVAWDEYYQENMRGTFADAPPDLRAELEASIVAQEFADRYPVMTRFLVADDGHFWLRDPVPIATMLEEDDWFRGDQSYSPTWTILSPEGRLLGRVHAPEGFHITDLRGDYVVGHRRDAFDVTEVVVYEIVRPDGG